MRARDRRKRCTCMYVYREGERGERETERERETLSERERERETRREKEKETRTHPNVCVCVCWGGARAHSACSFRSAPCGFPSRRGAARPWPIACPWSAKAAAHSPSGCPRCGATRHGLRRATRHATMRRAAPCHASRFLSRVARCGFFRLGGSVGLRSCSCLPLPSLLPSLPRLLSCDPASLPAGCCRCRLCCCNVLYVSQFLHGTVSEQCTVLRVGVFGSLRYDCLPASFDYRLTCKQDTWAEACCT